MSDCCEKELLFNIGVTISAERCRGAAEILRSAQNVVDRRKLREYNIKADPKREQHFSFADVGTVP
jgi:hypothetical protein